MNSVRFLCLPIFAYVLGSIPCGLILTKCFAGSDIRRHGSGNIGATNVRRVAGWKLGVLTLLADMAKGAIPVWLAIVISDQDLRQVCMSVTAFCAFFGHLYPIFLKFKDGGKGVATAGGTFLMISPMTFLTAIMVFIGGVVLTRRVSAGSLSAAVALAISSPIWTQSGIIGGCALLMAILIWIRHKDNIRRLLSGIEPALFMIALCLSVFPAAVCASPVMDEDVQAYLQAINEIEKNSLEPITRRDILAKSLKAYLKITDPFSAYLTPEEYDDFKSSQKSGYVGLGMEFEADASGRILCFPYPEGAAVKAGIRAGDVLESADGQDMTELSPFMAAVKSMGKEGTEAVLKILQKNGVRQEVRVKRTAPPTLSVRVEKQDEFILIRILSFTGTTRQELQTALADAKDSPPIILDLRGNPGGDLYAATDCATLFLEKDKTIVGVKSRAETKLYKNMTLPLNIRTPIYIWQDEGTANAAEVFIAAMIENGRAQSVGKKTLGKGVRQDIVELADGSALFITTAWLQTPEGSLYHAKGLEPTHLLEGDLLQREQYLARFCELIEPKTAESAAEKPLKELPPLILIDKPKAAGKLLWAIQFGSYSSPDAAIIALKQEKSRKNSRNLRLWVQIIGYKNDSDAQKDLKKFKKEGIDARLDNEQEAAIRYGVMIGLYPKKEDKLFKALKKDGLIGNDAYWVPVREN
jgi:carboxyl-terminal processing protease